MDQPRRHFIAATSLGTLATIASTGAVAAQTGAGPARPLPLTPQVTEGPFYLDIRAMRSDITEGMRGVPLEVRIGVVDVAGRAGAGYRVDLWHCDPTGLYSGFDGQGPGRTTRLRGRTFLRGTVVADDDGVAVFRTIYPGWYEGRTTHLHLKVFHGSRLVLTSQLFLPDALSEYLYTSLPAYRRATLRDTLNRADGIALEAGSGALGSVREEPDRYVVTATTVIDPDARPAPERGPGSGPNGPRPDRPPGAEGSGARPGFRLGQGGGLNGSIGLGGGGPAGDGRGPPPRDGGPRPPVDGVGPDRMPPRDRPVLDGEARVAAIVPGGAGS